MMGLDTKSIVKRVSLLGDGLVPPPIGVTVLIYHRVGGGSTSDVDLPAEVFDAQLAHLAEHARVVGLDTAVAELTDPRQHDEPLRPTVVITFDDGTDDFVDVAVPALVRHGLPATLYVATQYIDEQAEFPWGARPTSWAALRDTVATGLITIGSHTHSHWLLDRLEPAEVAADLDRSIELIGEHLGLSAQHFAYPKAMPGSAHAEAAVRQRFRSAALAASRVNRRGRTDPHRLWRTPVQCSDRLEHFQAKARGGMRLEGELRALVARVKYRGVRQ
jgi:peptidoglycan/xylan/chitin deacetylase (PgdA/CDA1 family)